MNDPIVGIDLGTSNSVVAHADVAGSVKVLSDDGGYKIHPSVVSFHPNGGVVVGVAAKQRKVIDPQNTIYSVKRLIGRGYSSPEVQTAKTRVPYQIKEGANQLPMIVTRAGEFAVPEVSAIVLDYVRNIAAARLGTAVQRAVVTVPASFNDAQRSATATAGAIAGLTVVRVLNEPTAAALAYGHTRNLREIIAVYDFGGGTFDITILKLEDQVYEVLGTAGDTFLGGDDLDERLVDKMVAKFLVENRIDLRTNEVSMMRLRAVAEQTKIELSRRSRAVVRVDEIAYGPRGVPLNLMIEITREEFVTQVADIIDRTFPVCQEALSVAGLGIDRIDDIVLVGGTTKIPYVRDQVSRFFAKAPRSDVNPEDAVAIGAALQATSLERILARPRTPSGRLPAVQPADEETTNAAPIRVDVLELAEDPSTATGKAFEAPSVTSETEEVTENPSGATMAPSELLLTAPPPDPRAKRPTAGYDPARRTAPDDKPDTSYSLTRGGARDRFEGKSKDAAPPPASQPIGRITRSNMVVPEPPPPLPPATPHKTMFGVPAAPDPRRRDDSVPGVPPPIPRDATTRGQIPLTRLPGAGSAGRPTTTESIPALSPAATAPGMGAESTTLPRLPTAAPDEWSTTGHETMPATPTAWEEHQTRPADPPPGWGATKPTPRPVKPPPSVRGGEPPRLATSSPASTQPLTPSVPIAPAAAPTLVVMPGPATSPSAASTAKGLGPALQELDREFEQEEPVTTAPPYQTPAYALPLSAPPAAQLPIPPGPVAPQRPPVVLEVTPRGLGIATVAGYCEELIRRNSRLPTQTKKLFTTSRDHQDLVRIVVCQGESRRLDNNLVIGDLVLQNLPPRPRGETSIEVTFSVDASGILQVRARDAQTGTEQRASLDLIGGIPHQDVAASRDRLQQLRR